MQDSRPPRAERQPCMIFHIVSHRAWIVASGACLAAALAMSLPIGLSIGDPNPLIHIRWREPLDAPARAALERQFGLEGGEPLDRGTWRYEATDPSRDMIRRIVGHPAVADTHYVDRTGFGIERSAPRAARRSGWIGAVLFLVLAAVAALGAARPQRLTAASLSALLGRGIPPLSRRGLALFRLVFGLTLAFYVYWHPFPREAVTADVLRPDIQFADAAPVRWLVDHPPVVRAGQWVAIVSAVLFALGIVPRLAYAVAVAGIVQWLVTFSVQSDGHPFGVLIFPLLCLLVVPWGDAPPVFGSAAGDVAGAVPDTRYGYAPWLLSFALGVAWAGAAWAKVREGPGWVMNGTVRYHFVSDAVHAPVDWGLAIATMPALAIALSAGGVLIESVALPVAFLRMPLLRLAVGLAAMSLLAGFYLFQGILWPAWWILLLGFLPWQWFDRSAAAAGRVPPSDVSRGQLLCIAGLALQQLVISAAFLEVPPIASRYDMYSKTHASTADYDRENPGIERRLIAEDERGRRTDVTACVGAVDPGSPPPPTSSLRPCLNNAGAPARYLLLEDRCRFDWNAGHRVCVRDTLIATLPVAD